MATILIAEDEYLVRVGLRTCLDWGKHGFVLLDDAVDGEDAYEKTLQYHPDILLLDIKMPKMDGFALLERFRRENINVNVIILSCLDDFESVRSALQYGVLDYINKLTINPADLLKALNKAPIQPVQNTYQNVAKSSAENIVKPTLVVEKLLRKESCSKEELAAIYPEGSVLCIAASPRPAGPAISSQLLISVISQQLKSNHVPFIALNNEHNSAIVLLPKTVSPEDYAHILYRQLCTTLNGSCAVGYSCYQSSQQLPLHYEFACQVEDYIYWELSGSVYYFPNALILDNETVTACKQHAERIKNHLLMRDFSGIIRQVEQMVETLRQSPDCSRDSYIRRLLSVLALFPTANVEKLYFGAQQNIIRAKNYRSANRALQDFISAWFKQSDLPAANYSDIVSTAIQYVAENPNTVVSLSEVAKKINVSESYLSQLFKKETNKNFNSFVHQYKINQAKELLRNRMLVYEVCNQIGFENANYFAKLFHRYTGMTPTEYKKKVEEENS